MMNIVLMKMVVVIMTLFIFDHEDFRHYKHGDGVNHP